jgi:hypothetical protein
MATDVTFGLGEKATGQPGVGTIEDGQFRKLARDAGVAFAIAGLAFVGEHAGVIGDIVDADPESIAKLAGLIAALFGWRVARPTSPDP